MLKLEQTVIVEGKYDKMRLSGFIESMIIETDGFGIFKDKEKQKFIKRLADEKGIIILTDSDAAGFKIRAFLGGMIDNKKIINVFIPDIFGKEKRKAVPSKEGKLGVEAVESEVILAAFEKAGINCTLTDKENQERIITSTDLYEYGFSGRTDSAVRRRELLSRLCLPARLSTSMLVKTINNIIGFDEFVRIAESISGKQAGTSGE